MINVCVLMSTYNGSKYLKEQIDSILSQQGIDIKLIVRDDGSSDNTWKLLEEYANKDSRVSIYTGKNLGPANSFINLIINSIDVDYYAFADQDDVWENNKILAAVKRIGKYGNDIPVMYYSNLKIVDKELNFYRLSHSVAQVPRSKYTAIVDNMATGCTIVFNKRCRDLVKESPPHNCTMHDAWLFLLCSIMGKVVYDKNAYILYRQHENNVIGTYLGKKTLKNYYSRIKRLFDRSIQPRYYNALSFYECYGKMLNPSDRKKILKLVNYKNNLKSKLDLLVDKDIRANSMSLDLRYRILIIMGII